MLHLVDIDLELSRARGSRKETREQRGFSHGLLLWSFKLESFDRRSPLPTNLSLSPYPSPNPKLILTSQSKQNVGLVNRPVPGFQILSTPQRKSSISSSSSSKNSWNRLCSSVSNKANGSYVMPFLSAPE